MFAAQLIFGNFCTQSAHDQQKTYMPQGFRVQSIMGATENLAGGIAAPGLSPTVSAHQGRPQR